MRKYMALAAISVVLLASCKNGVLSKKELSDFKVKDTAAVTKIFLADMNNHTVLLERTGGEWLVDGKFPVRPDLMQVLLETLYRLEVKQNVPKTAIENVVKTLSANHTKVEIYTDGKEKPAKVIYVGGPTQDHLGTYMLIEGSATPYVCYVPGERAYLSPRFMPFADEWRSRVLFDFERPEQIASVQVDSKEFPEESFRLSYGAEKQFGLTSPNGSPVAGFNNLRAKDYLKRFRNIGFARYTQAEQGHLDSLRQKYYLYRLTVNETSGKTTYIDLFRNPVPPGTTDDIGNPITYDLDEMFGIINDSILVVAQYYTFEPLTVPITWFSERGPAENPY